jgi:Subtilase family
LRLPSREHVKESGQLKTAKQSVVAVTRRLILSVDDQGLQTLERLVDGTGTNRSERQAFEEIRTLDRFSIASPAEVILDRPVKVSEITWEAVLHPRGSFRGEAEPLDPTTLEKWFKLVESLGGRCYRDYVRTVGGLTFSPVVASSAVIEQLSEFNPLRAIRPMPTVRPQPVLQLRATAPTVIPPKSGGPRSASPLVAVFDGGTHIPSTPSTLFPTPHIDLTPETEDINGLAHGTAVTGAVRFGLLLPGDTAPQPPCPIESFRVFPAPLSDVDGYWILDQIKNAVTAGKHNIVNLSVGLDLAVEDTSEPNRWTSELDQLARESDVLFIVAAGNNGAQPQQNGLHRVQVPADMVNGISVGACDEFHQPKWKRSHFSAMGPGRHGNRVQPTGVQFGGTPSSPFPMLTADGNFVGNHGTSFAAPLITHALADLATALPKPTPSVLRAFAVHFAARHSTHRKLIDEVGYGRMLLDYNSVLNSDPNEAHILFFDEIERGELLGYQLPVPTKIRDKIELVITLSYLSLVDPTQPTDTPAPPST